MARPFVDAQSALGFIINQASYIEPTVYETVYPDIQYPNLIPVDESAPDWVKSITFFSSDKVGVARWFHHMSTDMPYADVSKSKQEVGVEMAAVGYRYTLEEIGNAMMQGINLTPERAAAASRAYEEFVEKVAIVGDTDKNWTGLINDAGVNASSVTGGTWSAKTGDAIAADINAALLGIYTTSNTVEMADTLLLPITQFSLLATKRMDVAGTAMSVLEWIQRYNVYTAQTGLPLMLRAVRQLAGAGAGPSDRMVAYRRDPSIVKIHIPMRHRFLPVWQTGPIIFDIPGIFRLGGVEVRRPGAVRYVDGI